MAVKLRLRREGTTKRPHYRIVAADSRSPRDGRFIEAIGHYHPMDDPSGIEVDAERALHWLRNGAQPSDAVQQLLRITGVWEQFKPGDAPKRDRSARADQPRQSKKAREKAKAAAEAPPAAEKPEPEKPEPAAEKPEPAAAAEKPEKPEPAAEPEAAEPEAAEPKPAEPEAAEPEAAETTEEATE